MYTTTITYALAIIETLLLFPPKAYPHNPLILSWLLAPWAECDCDNLVELALSVLCVLMGDGSSIK